MDYPIFCFSGEAVLDALPVMKVRHYPFEPESYKPFAQGIICMKGRSLFMRLWAFEAVPEAVSELAAALKAPSGCLLYVSAELSGKNTVTLDGEDRTSEAEIRPIAGEDLQGEYWGVNITLSPGLTEKIIPAGTTEINGNFYKICEGSRPHFGSFYNITEKDRTACPATFSVVPF